MRYIYGDKEIPWTHDIRELLRTLRITDEPFCAENEAAMELTEYAVASRYPGDLWELTEDEIKNYLVLSRTIYEEVKTKTGTTLD